MNIDAILGEFILLEEGIAIEHPEYVKQVGEYYRQLNQLPGRNLPPERERHLYSLYSRWLRYAKFWVQYPGDLKKLSTGQRVSISLKLRKENLNID